MEALFVDKGQSPEKNLDKGRNFVDRGQPRISVRFELYLDREGIVFEA